ncbi:MAG: hypothetical protein RLZZ399_2160 [Verrucomicrobiota bacterium]|jgi:hypothetical protein
MPVVLWCWHAVAAGILVVPVVWFSRKRVRWVAWEWPALFLPFLIWALLMVFVSTGRKSLSNLVIEPLLLGGTVGFGAVFRAAMGARWPAQRLAQGALLGLCLAALAIFWMVPALPE